MEATAPDECLPLMDRAMFNPILAAWFDVPEYLAWTLQASHQRAVGRYRYHRKQLQLMQGDHPPRRWVLKAPLHGFFLHAVAQVYPDACFVFSHRNPRVVLASLCSLIAVVRGLFHDEVDLRAVGRLALELMDVRTRRLNDALGAIRPEQVVHLEFEDLVGDPLRTLRRIYPRFGLRFSDGQAREVEAFLDTQRRGPHTRHRYDLAPFGLADRAIDPFIETDSMALSV